jgi:hypothetical protein
VHSQTKNLLLCIKGKNCLMKPIGQIVEIALVKMHSKLKEMKIQWRNWYDDIMGIEDYETYNPFDILYMSHDKKCMA